NLRNEESRNSQPRSPASERLSNKRKAITTFFIPQINLTDHAGWRDQKRLTRSYTRIMPGDKLHRPASRERTAGPFARSSQLAAPGLKPSPRPHHVPGFSVSAQSSFSRAYQTEFVHS